MILCNMLLYPEGGRKVSAFYPAIAELYLLYEENLRNNHTDGWENSWKHFHFHSNPDRRDFRFNSSYFQHKIVF